MADAADDPRRLELATERLTLRPLADQDRDLLHALATDEHVRRYLLDGQVVEPSWADAQLAASQRAFATGGSGLWLAWLRAEPTCVGFGGFLGLPGTGLERELVYAVTGRFSGIGLGTELATALVAHAGARELRASVDAVNVASVRLLERLGFRRNAVREGVFGELWLYERSV